MLASLHTLARALTCTAVWPCSFILAQLPLRFTTLDEYIAREGPIAYNAILANIGPDGKLAGPLGAHPGIVIASPQTSEPDYVYTWTRDSALVFKVLIERDMAGAPSGGIDNFFAYVASQSALQRVDNPSGAPMHEGLGEPKFYCNKTAFLGSWGRPQRDGPALRATTIIRFANHLLFTARDQARVKADVWPVVKADLDYVVRTWNEHGYDLWEEVDSFSFFAAAVQHRALREGAALARTLGRSDHAERYTAVAESLQCSMQTFWDADAGYMLANTKSGRSGLDANTVLASIHTFDPEAGCSSDLFQPCSDYALANLLHYVESFRGLYPINADAKDGAAIAVGRYREDVYSGGSEQEGNPWYLTTLAVAEQLYLAHHTLLAAQRIHISALSAPFWAQLVPGVPEGTHAAPAPAFAALLAALRARADGFLGIVQRHTPVDGRLAEQFSARDGGPRSARDLTWSYAAALRAFDARAGRVPPSWGAAGLRTRCAGIAFCVNAHTHWGESVFVHGDVAALVRGVQLTTSPETYPAWTATVAVPSSSEIAYRYAKHDGAKVEWEFGELRVVTSPANGTAVVSDAWR